MGALRMGSTPTPAHPAWTMALSPGGTWGPSPAPRQGTAPFTPITSALRSSVLCKQRARQRSPSSACPDNTAEGMSRAQPQEWAPGTAECAQSCTPGLMPPSHEAPTAARAKRGASQRDSHPRACSSAFFFFFPLFFLPFLIFSPAWFCSLTGRVAGIFI